MYPNTGLTDKDVARKVLLVCGEDRGDVLAALDGLGVRYVPVKEYREFKTYSITGAGNEETTLCITGLGSASVEVSLTELFFCGARSFVLAGTCGSLSDHFRPGDLLLATGGERRDGASYHYNSDPSPARADPEFIAISEAALEQENITFKRGTLLSTDTFYCMGAGAGPGGEIEYPGVPLKNEFTPPPAFSELKSMIEEGRPLAIDMETAAFYAICSCFRNRVFNIAVKCVSNSVPFREGEQAEKTGEAVARSVRAALAILRGVRP